MDDLVQDCGNSSTSAMEFITVLLWAIDLILSHRKSKFHKYYFIKTYFL